MSPLPLGKGTSYREAHPLTGGEREEIVLAVTSAFKKLGNLYNAIKPIYQQYGFTPPSAGVIARDLSEKIEISIVQHCTSFQKGDKFADLQRFGRPWEVKICKGSGLTINQSKMIAGENYIVVNYRSEPSVRKAWVLWEAEDQFFTVRRPNANCRSINLH